MQDESPIDKALFDKVLAQIAFKFEDAKVPTDLERQHLARLMYFAFCDLRMLARTGQIEQARVLADAFHNVPLLMYRSEFSFRAFRDSLQRYQEKFQEKLPTNYLEELDKLTANSTQS